MTRFLLATDSVHTTAAALDYLEDRADVDAVVAVAVTDPAAPRDAADALNVVGARLTGVAVDRVERSGDPGPEILAAAADADVDEILIGAHGGDPGAEGVGSTARQVLAAADRPVVVVPFP
ncbi:MAG: universal stress protein [Halobacteriaceae archaeon]